MKHLANCTHREFLKQAMRLRAPFKAWLERTGIPEIRARRPEGYDDMTDEEKLAANIEQGRKNTPEIIAAALEKDFDRSIEILCLTTFTDPEHFDDHTLDEYILAVNEMMSDPGVRNFFTLAL